MRPLNDDATATGRKLRIAEGLVACIALVAVAIALVSADDASAATGSVEDQASGETNEPAAAAVTPKDATAAPRQGPRPRIRHAKLDRSRMILGAQRGVTFRFELAVKQPRKVLVKVVRVGSDKVQKRFRLGDVRPGQRQRVSWKGRTGKRGYIRQGKYAFRVYSGGERAAVGAHSSSSRFGFYKNRFPILGRHSYGDGLGAGRGHQGQDVFAKCGRPVVAAHAGRVQVRRYQSAAGYYVVIDGKGTGVDNAYMHLRERAEVQVGDTVYTGQEIGRVGDTGDAVGCHLHFEEWTAPGWYDGGRPLDPLPDLTRWDKSS
jgi:murein DD-endopeptidase MepM/ murein hydrolase activator NlpD